MNNPSTCPHFPLCSGCTLTDIFNPPVWQDAKEFFRAHDIEPLLHTSGFSQTRYKAKLAVRPGPEIGLFKKNTHDVLSIPNCLIHHDPINRAVEIIRKEMISQKISPYNETTRLGQIRYIQLFVHRTTNQIQLVLITTESLELFCKSLLKYDLWHSIWQNIHPSATNRILSDRWEQIYGEPFLWQPINDHLIPFHPGAFAQANLPLFEKMIQKIQTWVKPNDKVLELYAGVGAIGLCLSPLVKQITLVENNPYAHLSYQQTPKPNITYQCTDAKLADFTNYDLIIVDPPRKGLDPTILPKLESPQLIYISCGFESFKRDAQNLLSIGWKLKEAHGYILFPGTNHVETLALFKRPTSS
ncbi:MAG: hypothetical protein COT85_04960 [Chlamydiae bacterium CG10_big_fil_rev_8_21_14_0_10_42_34]|nr:MAG: hypothetical protein COT85_04960 [Chlamydiae bacterium CG10_big_fil_rev_8_21_14_0_10_42_34]